MWGLLVPKWLGLVIEKSASAVLQAYLLKSYLDYRIRVWAAGGSQADPIISRERRVRARQVRPNYIRLVMGVGGGHVSMYLIVVDVVTSRTALLEVANEGKK